MAKQGWTYEKRMCILLFIRGYIREMEKSSEQKSLETFQLRYEVKEAGKIDDVVFYDGEYLLIQLKHTTIEESKITHSDLFHREYNGDFNLIKYVKSVIDVNAKEEFKDKVKAAIVFTKYKLDLLKESENFTNKVALKRNSTSEKWYEELESKLNITLKSITLTPISLDFTDILYLSDVVPDAKYYKFTDDPNIVELLKLQAEDKETKHKQNVGDLDKKKIPEALKKIIFAVEQPDSEKLDDIIHQEIKNYFKLTDANPLCDKLEKQFGNWCDTKKPFGQLSTSAQANVPKQHILKFSDAYKFFQTNAKVVSFGVTAPTDSFIGRGKELKELKKLLYKKQIVSIVSFIVKISGLGGIGKTQLAKKFIEKFGKSEFYGRIVWIAAEDNQTVEESFKELAQVLNIEDARNKNMNVLIHDVLEYFKGLKVLFVFDNFDNSKANDHVHKFCKKISSKITENIRPYLLFTSRNRNCLPGVASLDLNVLSPEEAVELIKKELTEVNLTDADAEKLVKELHYFPLALRQAIAYIKQQHKEKQLFGKRYEIQDYFTKIRNKDKETKDLLDFKFPDEFEDIEKTTFITWNVTLDAIEADKVHGKNAIKVLQIFAYLYADKIDPKLFLCLFDNDNKKTAGALLLLEKFSMITKIEQEQSNFYQIHRLVQKVTQLKFKNEEKDNLIKSFELINPELYKTSQKNLKYDSYRKVILMKNCSVEQILHYNQLSIHMMEYDQLKKKYERFFGNLNNTVLDKAIKEDDVEKIKALEIPNSDLKNFLETNIDELMDRNCKKIIKYSIENGHLGVNDRIEGKSLIELSVKNRNVEIFKYLIEKGAELSEVLESATVELISDIKDRKSKLLKRIIKDKSDLNQKILNECLFFATIFNQESILRTLFKNIDKPYLEYKNWSLIEVAAKFGFENLCKIIFPHCNQGQLKTCLSVLAGNKNFSGKAVFELIYKKFLEKGGDLRENDELWKELCKNFNLDRLGLAFFLLDEGVDGAFSSDSSAEALSSLLEKHENKPFSDDDKRRFDKLLNRIIFNNMTSDKFINVAVKVLFKLDNWSTNEYYQNLFEKMVDQIGDINVRNGKGEKLLYKYLQVEDYLAFCLGLESQIETVKYLVKKHKIDIGEQIINLFNERLFLLKYVQWYRYTVTLENVKFFVENGVNVNLKNHKGRSVLYFAFHSNDEIFMYLLEKIEKVDEHENVLLRVIEEGKLSIVKALIPKYFEKEYIFKLSNKKFKKFKDKTPLEVAKAFSKEDIVDFLENLSDEKNETNKKRKRSE